MEIGERLQLSESVTWVACFREGMFMRFYDAHLGWFCQQGKPLKVLCREVKKLQGRAVLYGGLPDTTFQAWLAAQVPPLDVREQPWGLQLHIPGGLDKAALRGWCVAQQALATQSSTPATSGGEGTTEGTLVMVQQQILKELNQLALATCTPMQAMQWLARWQGLAKSLIPRGFQRS